MVSPEEKLILVVDDEARMVRFVRMNLELEGYQVSEAGTGIEALEKVRDDLPDLVLLDVMMPEMDGFETLERLREISTVPVIMLTVKGDEEDRIRGLELGADDYVTKPFSPRELASRITGGAAPGRDALPRGQNGDQDRRPPGDRFPAAGGDCDGERIRLRPTEYRLLYHLVNNAGWVMTHEMLLSKVWGYEYRDETGLLRLYITYLRKKIEPDPGNPRYIFTERGVGYRFVDYMREQEARRGRSWH